MNETDAPAAPVNVAAPRRARGFSLLALLWLLTVAALGIGLHRASQEVTPLREAMARIRKELGYFPVDDQSKIQVKRMQVKIPTAWQWRLFLPAGRNYDVRYSLGQAPDPVVGGEAKWLDMVRAQSRKLSDEIESGEFSYEALVIEYDGLPWLRTGKLADTGQSIALPPGSEWLADETAWVVSSDASYESVRSFEAHQPVMLLHIERSIHADAGGGDNSKGDAAQPAASGQRFVLWIEAERPAAATPTVPGVVR